MMITRLLAILLAAAVVAPAAADPVLLKVGFPSPPMSWTNTHGMTPWAQSVEKAADGLVEIKIFPGGSVANFRNVYDRVINGVVDIGFGPTGDISDQSPRSDVSSLPFEVRNASEASLALWRLFAKGELAPDYKAVKPVSLFALPTTTLHSSKPIRALADMRGMRLIVLSRLLGQAISTVDGTPLTMTAAEAYQSIDRGVADGAAIAWAGGRCVQAAGGGEVPPRNPARCRAGDVLHEPGIVCPPARQGETGHRREFGREAFPHPRRSRRRQ